MNVIIFGPPLAGKGTQSKKIINKFQLTHLSTGDVLRKEKDQKTALGIQAATYSDQGLLAPDSLVSKIVENYYKTQAKKTGFLFDGYPRNTAQAKHLLQVLVENQTTIDYCIYLNVPSETLLQRAIVRAAEEGRKDDKDTNVVHTRIQEFETYTIPAIEYLKQTGIKTLEIDGNQPIDTIFQSIESFIK